MRLRLHLFLALLLAATVGAPAAPRPSAPAPSASAPAPSASAHARSTSAPARPAPALSGQPPVVATARLDRTQALLGETIRMTVEVAYAPDAGFRPPPADHLKLPPFEVRDAVVTPLPPQDGRDRVRYAIRLAAYREGELKIPPMKFRYAGGVAATPVLAVAIVPTKPAPGEKPDAIRGLKALSAVGVPVWMYAAGAAAVLLAVLALAALMRRLKRRRRASMPPPPLPHEWALQQLAALAAQRLPALGRSDEHYRRLSEILRGYLAQRYAIPVLERTTSEVLADMRAHGFPDNLYRPVRELLEEADLVKFARMQPVAERAEALLLAARGFVEATGPVPVPPAEPGIGGSNGRGAHPMEGAVR